VKAAQPHDHSGPWAEEIRRRVESLESGNAELIEWDEFRRQLEAKYAQSQDSNTP
jgi:hypothetical protein